MKKYKILIAVAFILSLPTLSFSQEKILTDQVEITKSYLPEVGKAKKRDVRPSEEASVSIEIPELKYNITYTPERYPFTFTQLTAPSYKINKDEELNKGYLEAGIGLPLNSALHFGYGSTSGINSIFAIRVDHDGFWGKLKDELGEKQSATTTENSLGAMYEYKNKDFRIKLDVNQAFDKYNRYGLSSDVEADNISQHFLKSVINAEIGSNFDNMDKFNYNIYAQINVIVDNYGFSETTYKAGALLSHNMKEINSRIEGTIEYISTVPSRDFILYPNNSLDNFTPPTDSYGATTSTYDYSPTGILSVAPQYVFDYHDVNIRVGAQLALDFNGNINNYKQGVATFIPKIKLSYNIADGVVTPYVAADGNYQMNNYFTLSELNPYIMEGLTAPNTVLRRYVIGLDGNIEPNISYKVEAGIRDVKDLLMFVNIEDGNIFSTIQDDYCNLELLAELGYLINDELHIDLSFNYINYKKNYDLTNDTNETVIGYAPLTIKIDGYYKVSEDLTLQAGIKYLSGRYFGEAADDDTITVKEVGGCLDLGVKGEYMLDKKLGVNLRLSNLLNQELYPYGNYKGVGISALAGISYRF